MCGFQTCDGQCLNDLTVFRFFLRPIQELLEELISLMIQGMASRHYDYFPPLVVMGVSHKQANIICVHCGGGSKVLLERAMYEVHSVNYWSAYDPMTWALDVWPVVRSSCF
jgi:hypothetical protein